jgi:hypothetical protein
LTTVLPPLKAGHHTTYVAFDSMKNIQHHLRPLYETQVCDDNNYTFSPKISAAPYVAGSDGVGISEIHPERNTIKLENGNQIEYGQLVLSYGNDPLLFFALISVANK